MSDFEMMDLPPKLVARLNEMGIKDPTPIQKQAIPYALNGRDVLGLAQTGTGKTAAFGVPLVAQMLAHPQKPASRTVRALVLAPTRELALQVSNELNKLRHTENEFKLLTVYGGVSIDDQTRQLR